MSYTSEVEIWNLALTRMGHKPVGHPEEISNEARLCRVLYPQARDMMLRGFDWSFAREVKALAKLDDAEIIDNWRFAYALPQDSMAIRRIVDPNVIPSLSTSVFPFHARHFQHTIPPFELGFLNDGEPIPFELTRTNDRSAMKLLCDLDEAKARYTIQELDVGFFDPLFGEAISWELQANLTRAISKSDQKERDARGLSQFGKSVAMAATMNEFAPRRKATPRSIAARQ